MGDALTDLDFAFSSSTEKKPSQKSSKGGFKKFPLLDLQRSPEDQLQYWNQVFFSFEGKSLSEIEKQDLELTKERFLQPVKNDLQLTILPILKKNPGARPAVGSPAVLILCQSAIRCVELIRTIPECHKRCKVAKLFAKHLGIEDQKRYLSCNHVEIAVGTPGRVAALIAEEKGNLQLQSLSLVVVDASWRDAKDRTIFLVPEVRADLFNLIHKVVPQRQKRFSVLLF